MDQPVREKRDIFCINLSYASVSLSSSQNISISIYISTCKDLVDVEASTPGSG